MKTRMGILILILSTCLALAAFAREAEDYIEEAGELRKADDLAGAMELMQAAVAEHPEHSDANAYLGLYTGMMAGQTGDYMEAGRLITEASSALGPSAVAERASSRAARGCRRAMAEMAAAAPRRTRAMSERPGRPASAPVFEPAAVRWTYRTRAARRRGCPSRPAAGRDTARRAYCK